MQLAQDKFWPWATPQLLLLFPWHWQSEFSPFCHPHNLFVALIMASLCGFRSSKKTWHVQYYMQLPGLAPHPLPLDHLPPGPSTDQQSVQQNVSKTSRDQCLALAILLSDTHGFLIHCSLNGVQAEHKNAELASEKNTLNRWSANVWMTRMTVSWWKKSSKKLLVSKKLLSQSKILTLSWHSPRASKPLLGSAKCKPCLGMRLRVVGIPPWLQPAHHTTLHIDVHGSWVWKHFGGLIYLDHAYFSTKKVLRVLATKSKSHIWQCCCLSWTLTPLQHLVVHPWPHRLSGVRYLSPHGQVKKDMSAWSAPSASFKISSFCKRRSFVANPNHEGFCISWLYTFLHRGLKGLSKNTRRLA